jgi:hypothetical protein
MWLGQTGIGGLDDAAAVIGISGVGLHVPNCMDTANFTGRS